MGMKRKIPDIEYLRMYAEGKRRDEICTKYEIGKDTLRIHLKAARNSESMHIVSLWRKGRCINLLRQGADVNEIAKELGTTVSTALGYITYANTLVRIKQKENERREKNCSALGKNELERARKSLELGQVLTIRSKKRSGDSEDGGVGINWRTGIVTGIYRNIFEITYSGGIRESFTYQEAITGGQIERKRNAG